MEWIPKTVLGKAVKEGKIKTMSEALKLKLPLREPEIVDILLPNLEEQVLDVNMVQRMTDSGRRVKFGITVVVGNSNGFVGLGHAKGSEVGPSIRKAIDNAKLHVIEVRRGCGSWECGCWSPHSLPFAVTGKSSSTVVTLKPAPKGVSLAAGETAKHILRLAGIKDIWVSTKGQTRTTINFAKATFDALRKTAWTKVMKEQIEKLKIASGSVEIPEEVKEGEKAKEPEIEKEGVKERPKEISEGKGKVEEKVDEEKGKELESEEEKIKEEKKKEEKIEGEKKELKETAEKKEHGKLEGKPGMKEKGNNEEKKTKEKTEVKEEEKSKEVERKKEKEKTEEKNDTVEKVEG